MAQPDRRFVPGDLQGQAGWFQIWNDGMQAVGASLGFSGPETDRIKDDNSMMQFVAATALVVNAFDDAVRSHRRVLLFGDVGDPTPAFPAGVSPTPPTSVPTGVWERNNEDIGRVRKAPAYTEETGSLLGIIATTPTKTPEADVKPTIEAFAAATNYQYSVVVGNRVESDMWQVWILPKGVANWALAATANGKSIDITATPTTPGEPMIMQVRIQLRKSNANYGQLSDVVYVTVNP